jgi:hypothetical protein
MRWAIVTATLAALALAVWVAWPKASDKPASATPREIVTDDEPAGELINGWPSTTRNPAGQYSWDGGGRTCAARLNCIHGFMHNGYASGDGRGDVEISIQAVRKSALIPSGGEKMVTVAGEDALHRRIDAGTEEWIVGIRGKTLAIRLKAKAGTSDAELAEAHAIIKSMRTEPRDTNLGFRLVYTLKTDDWDSG